MNVAHDRKPRPLTLTFPAVLVQAIHSVGWHHEGKQFMCSHSDGSLTMWNLRNTTKPIQITFPHGERLKPFKSFLSKQVRQRSRTRKTTLIGRVCHGFVNSKKTTCFS